MCAAKCNAVRPALIRKGGLGRSRVWESEDVAVKVCESERCERMFRAVMEGICGGMGTPGGGRGSGKLGGWGDGFVLHNQSQGGKACRLLPGLVAA